MQKQRRNECNPIYAPKMTATTRRRKKEGAPDSPGRWRGGSTCLIPTQCTSTCVISQKEKKKKKKNTTLFARVRSQVPNVSELAIVSRCRRCKSLKEQLLRLFRFSFSLFPTADEMKQTIPPFFFSAHRADESRRILKERECEILARFVSLCYSDGEKIGAHSGREKRNKKK